MQSFRQILVVRIQAYFKQKYGLIISDEVAQDYLKSDALMFEVFTNKVSE